MSMPKEEKYYKGYNADTKVEAYVRPSIKENVEKLARVECVSRSKAVEIALDTYFREHPVKERR